MSKTALVTGITGQDGFYLTNYLLEQGYRVVGLVRRTSLPTDSRLRTLRGSPNLHLVHGDIDDITSIQSAIREFQPQEFYHLAAQSHVAVSWQVPIGTATTTGLGVLNCLEALRQEKPDCRFYFAGSSEQFGNTLPDPGGVVKIQDRQSGDMIRQKLHENSPMHPESPYAAAKVFGYNITRVYRRSFDMFASCGILFNHESPVRGEEFVTRKITRGLARVKWGLQEYIELGNMDASRDWGFAGDYVRAMYAMLQHYEPDDFVIATGATNAVKLFFNESCNWFGLDPEKVYKFNPKYMRPKDVDVLLGDSSKAQRVLQWTPECDFDQLVDKMCRYDYHLQSPDPSYSRKADEYLF